MGELRRLVPSYWMAAGQVRPGEGVQWFGVNKECCGLSLVVELDNTNSA